MAKIECCNCKKIFTPPILGKYIICPQCGHNFSSELNIKSSTIAIVIAIWSLITFSIWFILIYCIIGLSFGVKIGIYCCMGLLQALLSNWALRKWEIDVIKRKRKENQQN